MESHYPTSVKALPNYRLLITFDNGEQRLFDATPYLGDKFFSPLRSVAVFNSAKTNSLTVEWAGGIDMCPDELYFNSEPCPNA
jgi:hypothetical protein